MQSNFQAAESKNFQATKQVDFEAIELEKVQDNTQAAVVQSLRNETIIFQDEGSSIGIQAEQVQSEPIQEEEQMIAEYFEN